MHFEQHTELDNLIAMQNLRTFANKGSNDAYDVSISPTREEEAAGELLHVTDDMLAPTNPGEELLAHLAVVTCHCQDVALSLREQFSRHHGSTWF